MQINVCFTGAEEKGKFLNWKGKTHKLKKGVGIDKKLIWKLKLQTGIWKNETLHYIRNLNAYQIPQIKLV